MTKIMIPGLCEGETDVLAEATGVAVEKGPADLKALPSHFGQADARAAYGERDIRVFAEINHVPRLSRDEILAEAERFRETAPTSSTSGSRSGATGSTTGRTRSPR